jgi:tetratricopeptide (TPR) repeat protein
MKDVGALLESQRRAEHDFVVEAAGHGAPATGWPAPLVMFHIARWRERLLHAMSETANGRPFDEPPANIDDVNDAELIAGAKLSLAEAAAESDAAFGGLLGLWEKLGDRPFKWYMASTTGQALVRNSYSHPRIHLAQYHIDRGDRRQADEIYEEAATQLRRAEAPPHILGAMLLNLAGARAMQGRPDEALDLLEEGLPMRTDLIEPVATEADFASLREMPRFRALVARYSA